MNIIQFGINYYVEDNGKIWKISYEEYLTICELESGLISEDEIEERVEYHKYQHEYIECPSCGKGTIRRDIAEDKRLLEDLHDNLVHLTSDLK